jgi:1,2-diacylglycerol 3-alpha-glucosyltransferase
LTLRIGQFTDTFLPIVDGVGRVVYSYATTLPKKGHECYVVAPMADVGYMGGMPFELIEFVSMSVPIQPQYNSGVPLLDAHYDARINRIPLDIVHAHSPFVAGQAALRIARKKNIPAVGMFHSRYYDDFYKLTRAEMLANIGVKFIVNFYQRCDEVWTVSQSSADTLHDYGYKGDITVIPNGTPDVAPLPERRTLAKNTFHLPDHNVLMYCGQLNWKKNILRILEACALLMDRGMEFTLLLTGQGPDAHAIEKKVEEFGLTQRTVFTGHITDENLLYGLYEAANLFVFPSLYDTSGMVVREAAAMETPSVVVAGSAPAEPIHDGVNGYLCQDSAFSLMEAVYGALSDPESLSRVGKNARETIYFSWDSIMDDVIARYEDLIERFHS